MNEIDKMAIIILCDMDYDCLDEESIPAAKKMWQSWLNSFDDPKSPWYKRKHMGDCTKECNPCITCLVDEIRREAKELIDFLDSDEEKITAWEEKW